MLPTAQTRGPLLEAIDLKKPIPWRQIHNIEVHNNTVLEAHGEDPSIILPLSKVSHSLSPLIAEFSVSVDRATNLQVYWDVGAGFTEQNSKTFRLAGGLSHDFRVNLPPSPKALRLDPTDYGPCRLGVVSITFRKAMPSGLPLFPFTELIGDRPEMRWLEVAEIQQEISERLFGSSPPSWDEWVFNNLLPSKIESALHVGCRSLDFGRSALCNGYLKTYACVPHGDSASELLALADNELVFGTADQVAPRTFDMILCTGVSNMQAGAFGAWQCLKQDGWVVYVDRINRAACDIAPLCTAHKRLVRLWPELRSALTLDDNPTQGITRTSSPPHLEMTIANGLCTRLVPSESLLHSRHELMKVLYTLDQQVQVAHGPEVVISLHQQTPHST